MNAPLYVERWLLDLKAAAAAAGLEAHVRALDVKGGQRLAFELRSGDELVEFRYLKRRTGARQLAAATGAAITARARAVHRRLLEDHPGLLENGRRRFLRRSLLLLDTLETAFARDLDFPARAREALVVARGPAGSRPAAVARVSGHLRRRIEVLPAAALSRGALARLAGIQDGRLVELTELLPQRKRGDGEHRFGVADVLDGIDAAVNLSGLGIELVRGIARRAGEAAVETAVETAAQAPDAVAGLAEAVGESGGVAAEAAGAAAEGAGAAAEGAGSAVEIIAHGGTFFGDAACAGLDCGGLDCIPG